MRQELVRFEPRPEPDTTSGKASDAEGMPASVTGGKGIE